MAALKRQTSFRNIGLIHGYMHVTGKPPLDDLSKSCCSLGMEVHYPELPDKSTQPKLSAWLEALNRTMPAIGETTALVGLSMGSPTALHLIAQEHVKEVGLLILIAPVTPNTVSDALPFLAHFFEGLNDAIEQVARKVRLIEILTSDNDPWARLDCTINLAKRLGTGLHMIHNGGHLDSDAGFNSFPLVLDMIAPVVEVAALAEKNTSATSKPAE
jgi:predicted alpha/beta hydrolase family esterase